MRYERNEVKPKALPLDEAKMLAQLIIYVYLLLIFIYIYIYI